MIVHLLESTLLLAIAILIAHIPRLAARTRYAIVFAALMKFADSVGDRAAASGGVRDRSGGDEGNDRHQRARTSFDGECAADCGADLADGRRRDLGGDRHRAAGAFVRARPRGGASRACKTQSRPTMLRSFARANVPA